MFSAIRKAISSCLIILYPYLVYRGMQAGWVWLAPAIVASVLMLQVLRANDSAVRYKKLAVVLLLVIGMLFFQSITAKLIPTLVQLALMHFFGKTLFKGPPLIERFVRYEYTEIPADVLHYCRQLTWLWSGFFAANAIICTVLAFWGPPAWWAFYTGVLMFVFTGLLMIGEYIFRHFRFPNMEIADIKATIRNMVINSRQIWLDVQAS